jgi:tRNA-binding protein
VAFASLVSPSNTKAPDGDASAHAALVALSARPRLRKLWVCGGHERDAHGVIVTDGIRGKQVDQFTPAPIKPNITVTDVDKLDVRVGTVVGVDEVPKSSKLLKLTVDFGDHRRAILAGMKTERADPQELVGVQALFVVNLEPKRMAGELSQGMLFDIGFADGITPVLAMPERAVPNGVRAG